MREARYFVALARLFISRLLRRAAFFLWSTPLAAARFELAGGAAHGGVARLRVRLNGLASDLDLLARVRARVPIPNPALHVLPVPLLGGCDVSQPDLR